MRTPTNAAGHLVDQGSYRQVGECRVCGVPMVGKNAWQRGTRPEGFARHDGHGYCSKHYAQVVRRGQIPTNHTRERGPRRRYRPRPDGRAPIRTRDEVLEDYLLIRDEVFSVAQAAERMGMTEAALEKALERARKDGLDGRTPGMMRGTSRNQYTVTQLHQEAA
jgi:hypothetical protein